MHVYHLTTNDHIATYERDSIASLFQFYKIGFPNFEQWQRNFFIKLLKIGNEEEILVHELTQYVLTQFIKCRGSCVKRVIEKKIVH